jgi:hypothetical protein
MAEFFSQKKRAEKMLRIWGPAADKPEVNKI